MDSLVKVTAYTVAQGFITSKLGFGMNYVLDYQLQLQITVT